MKKILHNPLRWVWAVLLLALQLNSAHASHIQGGQISYSYIGPGAGTTDRYSVTVSFFRDCTGISLPGTVTLQASSSGCNGIPALSVTLTPAGPAQVGTPYCGRVQQTAQCNSSSLLPLYEYQDFTGTIDLQPAPEWTLSVEDSARPNLANLSTTQVGFRFEAKLYSRIVPTSGQGVVYRNNSPRFSPLDLPVPFIPVNQPATVSFATTEPDGDSLVYALDAPLFGCGQNNGYQARPGPACVGFVRAGCNFVCPPTNGPGTLFTPQVPIAVGYDTTVCANGTRTLTPRLRLDPNTGIMTFTPNRYLATPPVRGDNKYVVVCNIKEYRRVANSNRRVLVGSVRRDFLVTIVVGTPNGNPLPPVTVIDSTSYGTGIPGNQPAQVTRIVVKSCNFSQANIKFTDPDNSPSPAYPGPNGQGQLLTITYTGGVGINQLLQNGNAGSIGTYSLRNNGTISPTLLLSFQPDPSTVGQILRLPFRIEDDNCPLKGVQLRVIEIEVRDGRNVRARATVASPGLPTAAGQPVTICPGGAVNLTGAITAVDSVRQVTGGRVRTVAQTYQYRWYARNRTTAGLPPVTTGANLTVRPTVTTRYTLFTNPNPLTSPYSLDNQGLSVCGDSISVLVRVVPEPVLALRAAPDTVVCAGTTVTLTGQVSRADNLADTYTYRWNGPGIPATATNTTVTFVATPPANPTGNPTSVYTLTATGDPRFGCDVTKAIRIRVVPNAQAAFGVDSVASPGSTGARAIPPITYTLTNRSTLSNRATPFAADTVRYTYQLVRDVQGRAVSGRPEITIARGPAALLPVTVTLLEPGYYILRLRTATTAGGQQCAPSLAQRTLFVPFFQIPNIITPNADGKNDVFIINGAQLGSKLEIFNRWGRKMEEYGNYQNQWGAENQAPGVYYYQLTEPKGTVTKGWVEVIK